MGPKTQKITGGEVPVVGAKIATITIGSISSTTENNSTIFFQIKVNLNCPVDIILDYLRRQFSAAVDTKLREILNQQENGTQSGIGQENGVGGPSESGNEDLELQSRLQKVKSILMNESISNFEIFDGVNSLSCQQRLKALGTEIMTPGGQYSFGYLTTNDAGHPISVPFSLESDSKASASQVKKK